MAQSRAPGWGIWLWSGASGVAFALVLVLLFRAPTPIPAPVRVAQTPPPLRLSQVQKGATDPLFSADSALLDPTPLFLPTEWNSGIKKIELPAFDRQLGLEYPPEDRLSEPQLALIRKDPSQAVTRAEDVFKGDPPDAPFLGFGHKDYALAPVSARGARVDVFNATTGERVYADSLEASMKPPGPDLWKPVEFAAAVDAAGLVGPLVGTASSGIEEVDSFFRTYLDRNLKLGLRLSPGLYRITVGP